jgi:ABC-type nitrate/sulfonate/bicarbonate transport system permease component
VDLVFGAILLAALLSVGLYGLVIIAERLLIPWHAASRSVNR